MTSNKPRAHEGLFPAMMKYWRGRQGFSQLDLSVAADISVRHVSFLETGRSKPSQEMVLRIAHTLEIPLREQNELLQAAGYEPVFPETTLQGDIAHPIKQALHYMLDKHMPYPMIVMDWSYDILMQNNSATLFLQQFIAEPESAPETMNGFDLVFNPKLARPFIIDWERIAQRMLSKLHKEMLLKSYDTRLRHLLNRLLSYPDVPASWQHPNFEHPVDDPILLFKVERNNVALSFFSTITTIAAPNTVSTEELYIESYFPYNSETETAMKAIANSTTSDNN